jgi:hypothetical protein
LPRASFTIVEGSPSEDNEKVRAAACRFLRGPSSGSHQGVEQGPDRDTAIAFTETERVLGEYLDKLGEALKRTDGSLNDPLKRAREKIIYQLEHLRTRFIHSSAHREETTYRQVERAFTTLYPDKNLQERELNVYYFLSRYGPTLIRDLYDAVELGFSNHKLVYAGGVASQVVNAR